MLGSETIIVDWGTTNFRAFRFDAAGELVAQHRAAAGIMSITEGRFEAALAAEIGAWLAPGRRLYLSGMITSRNGWVETPYVECPAQLPDLAQAATRRDHPSGATMLFLPGLCMRKPAPDVMRGEEIQVFGAAAPEEDVVLVLPGTHSKWVRHGRGTIAGFHTFMTGEIFAALRDHTILGRLLPAGAQGSEAAFEAGVRAMREQAGPGLLHAAFSARSRALFGELAAEDIAEYLSGLVIGAEMAGGLALGWKPARLRLVGEPALTRRYARAAALFDLATETGPDDATIRGFRRLAALTEGHA